MTCNVDEKRAVDAAVWRATFREVKTQVANLRNKECVPPSIVNLETGEWVNLKESDGNEGGGSTMWPPRQWYYAFEILVGWLAIVCFVLERAVRVICYLVI